MGLRTAPTRVRSVGRAAASPHLAVRRPAEVRGHGRSLGRHWGGPPGHLSPLSHLCHISRVCHTGSDRIGRPRDANAAPKNCARACKPVHPHTSRAPRPQVGRRVHSARWRGSVFRCYRRVRGARSRGPTECSDGHPGRYNAPTGPKVTPHQHQTPGCHWDGRVCPAKTRVRQHPYSPPSGRPYQRRLAAFRP